MPQIVIIAGFPGVGKSTLANQLQKETGWVLLDKDELTRGITGRIHRLLGLPEEDRESHLHKTVVRELTHTMLYNAANEVLRSNHSVILDAPFEQYIQEDDWYPSLVKIFNQNPFVVWVEIPKEQELQQLIRRNRDLDKWKINHFEEYYKGRENLCLKVPDEFLFRISADYIELKNLPLFTS
ncbi:MAG: AAA family ATPase [Lachnospiraceae bacterium]